MSSPPVNIHVFFLPLQVFQRCRMRTVFNYFDVGGKLPSAEILVNENVPFTTLFFLFVLRCFTLEQLSHAIYLPLLLPFLLDTYGYICAEGLKKSGLACCKRTGSNFM